MTMKRRTRANPKGLSRSIGMASTTPLGGGVTRDSIMGFVTAPPEDDGDGFDVKDWNGIHVTCISEAAPVEANPYYIQVRVWRFYKSHTSRVADGRVVGRWVQDYDRYYPLNAPAMANASQHHVYDTRNADKMYLQIVDTIVESEEEPPPPFLIEWLHIQPWGYVRKDEPIGVDISSGAESAPGGGGGEVTFPAVYGPEDEPVPANAVFTGMRARAAQRPPVSNDGDLVGMVGNRFGELVIAGYNWIIQAIRTEEVNPIYVRQDPVAEIEEPGGVTQPVGNPIEVFIDMNTFQHHGFQVVTDHLDQDPADLVRIDLAYTARVTGTPAALPPTDWTRVNTAIFGTPADAALSNATGDINEVFFGNFFRGQWLRLRAWASNPGGIAGNVALWVLRQSWY
jgi:hypothetical protein